MASTPESPKRVLVVDDETDARDLMRLILEPLGYSVTCARDGKEALVLVRERTFEVALVDLLMPGMSGKTFLTELDRLPRERTPVVIVTSASRDSHIAREVAGLKVFEVVPKPFDLSDIEESVGRAFQEKIRRSGT